jgi:hypothetical protein
VKVLCGAREIGYRAHLGRFRIRRSSVERPCSCIRRPSRPQRLTKSAIVVTPRVHPRWLAMNIVDHMVHIRPKCSSQSFIWYTYRHKKLYLYHIWDSIRCTCADLYLTMVRIQPKCRSQSLVWYKMITPNDACTMFGILYDVPPPICTSRWYSMGRHPRSCTIIMSVPRPHDSACPVSVSDKILAPHHTTFPPPPHSFARRCTTAAPPALHPNHCGSRQNSFESWKLYHARDNVAVFLAHDSEV